MPWIAAAAIPIAIVSILIVVAIVRAYVRAADEEKKAEVVKTMLEGIGGFAILVGLIFTWLELTNTRTATEEGQRADRFTAAMEGLAGDAAESKAASVVVLSELAEADPAVYAKPVQEALTAFVRRSFPTAPRGNSGTGAISGAETSARGVATPEPVPYEARLALDALLNQPRPDGECLDLSRLDLRGVGSVFRNRTITNVCFNSSLLTDVAFSGSHVEDTTFRGSDLDRARFVDSTVRCVRFVGASVAGADFRGSTLTQVGFDLADLSGAVNLNEDQLQDSDYLDAIPPSGTWQSQPHSAPDQWNCPDEPMPIGT